MTDRRDPEMTIRRWLADGAEHAPERAVVDTIERLRATDQPRMLVVNIPIPLAAALGLVVVLLATLMLWSSLAARPPAPSATPSPMPSGPCSLEIAASGRNGVVFVGRGFSPDTDVVLDIDRADGSHVTIRPTDLSGLHTDDQGRFGVTLYGSPSDVGTDVITAGAGCTASVTTITTASQLPAPCPADAPGSIAFKDGSSYRAVAAADHPVHWWHLDEGPTDVFADSIGSANGTRVGNVQPIPAAGPGHAALFDGSGSFVRVPEITLNDFTIEAWVYLCGLISNEDAIVGHGQGPPNINFFEQHLRLFLGEAGDIVVATTLARADTWEHWAIERDNAGTRIFRNGVLDASGPPWADALMFDEIGRGDVGVLHGLLDEVAIYDKALTADQVAAHAAAGEK
jgi:hypothetical protein